MRTPADDPFLHWQSQKLYPKEVIANIKAYGVEKYKKLTVGQKLQVRAGKGYGRGQYGYPGGVLEPHLEEIKKLWLDGHSAQEIADSNPKKFSKGTVTHAINSMKKGLAPVKISALEIKDRLTKQVKNTKIVKEAYDTLLEDYKKRGLNIKPSPASLKRQSNLTTFAVRKGIEAENLDVERNRPPEIEETRLKKFQKYIKEQQASSKELRAMYSGQKVVGLAGPEKLKKEYLEEFKKRLQYPKSGTEYKKAVASGKFLNNSQLATRFNLGDVSNVDRINTYILRKNKKLKYAKGIPGSGGVLRKKRLSITQPGSYISGKGRFHQFHHIMPIGGETLLTSKDVAFVTKKMNSAMQGYNNILNRIADGITDNLNKSVPDLKRIDELNAQAAQVVDKAKNELPKKFRGLVGFNQIVPITDEYGTLINTSIERIGIDEARTPGGVKGPRIPLTAVPSGTYTPTKFLESIKNLFNSGKYSVQNNVANALNCGKSEGGRIGYALGTATINCVNQKLTNEPVQSSMRLRGAEGVGKIRGAATNFLKLLGRGGVKAAPYAAITAGGAAAAGLVKTFMNDDPSTYLSDENQQKNMLIDMITSPLDDTPQERPDILDWQLPVLGAETALGTAVTAPSTIEAARSARFGKTPSGITKTALKSLGRGLMTTGTPLGLAALEPLHIAGQIQQGDSPADIATNPWNYLGPTFASSMTKAATKGLGSNMGKIMRLGLSPTALRGLSRFGGYGLAASLGIQGLQKFDDWRNKRGWFSEE